MADTIIDRDARRSDGKLKAVSMADEMIPKGVLVCIDTDGYAVNGSDAADLRFMGVSYERVDNSEGSPGDKEIRVEKTGEFSFEFNASAAVQSSVGKEVYIVDNQTVATDALVTDNDIKCGIVSEVISPGLVRIRIDKYTI